VKGENIMKSTGIVRPLDELGRIVIPKEICRTHGLEARTPMEIYIEGENIILRKYNPGCIICGSMDGLFEFGKVRFCHKHKEMIKEALNDGK